MLIFLLSAPAACPLLSSIVFFLLSLLLCARLSRLFDNNFSACFSTFTRPTRFFSWSCPLHICFRRVSTCAAPSCPLSPSYPRSLLQLCIIRFYHVLTIFARVRLLQLAASPEGEHERRMGESGDGEGVGLREAPPPVPSLPAVDRGDFYTVRRLYLSLHVLCSDSICSNGFHYSGQASHVTARCWFLWAGYKIEMVTFHIYGHDEAPDRPVVSTIRHFVHTPAYRIAVRASAYSFVRHEREGARSVFFRTV